MNFIIIADKFQKRMKSKGCVGLIKDKKNKTIIEKQHSIINKYFPKSKIIYVYGFDHKRLESFIAKQKKLDDITYIYNSDFETYNTVYSLYLAQEYLDQDCCILFGDQILYKSIFNNFEPDIGSQVFINPDSHSDLGCVIQNNIIHNISYGLTNDLSEIYFLCKSEVLAIREMIQTQNLHQYFLFEIINKLIDKHHTIYCHYHK